MKKLLCAALIAFTLCGCSDTDQVKEDGDYQFVELERYYGFSIVYDKETGVMYTISRGTNGGEVTLLVNADGSPKLYKGEKNGSN